MGLVPARFVMLLCLIHTALAAPSEDLVPNLPGLKVSPVFKQYSGYLNGTKDDKLHYWLVESGNNPATDPLVVWLNGGPGCSSLLGLLTENGPFRVLSDGKTIGMNKYSWNKIANVLYLEAPAKVGYSYSPGDNYTTGDDEVSLSNYNALKSFFKKFPEFKKNDFYITGESYGGYYVPTLSVRVVNDPDINFKGMAIGNGLSGWEINLNSQIYFAYYHGLIGDLSWNILIKKCCSGDLERCEFTKATDPDCRKVITEAEVIIESSGLNVYNLYGPCLGTSVGIHYNSTLKKATYGYLAWKMSTSSTVQKHKQILEDLERQGYKVKVSPPCVDTKNTDTYLNSDPVRKALHIPNNLPPWEECSTKINMNYKTEYTTMTKQYQMILSKGFRVMVYNGDVDMACNFLGDEWFVNSLDRKVTEARKIWYYKAEDGSKQVAGFVKEMEGISLVTVRGAGHMVPTDKPLPAYIMFSNFIQNKPF